MSDSLCDRCSNPGQCCSGFNLNFHEQPETYLEALVVMAISCSELTENGESMRFSVRPEQRSEHVWVGHPFLPLYKSPQGFWRFWCPHLSREGRCTIYEERPAICRTYEAGSCKLCAMHGHSIDRE